MAVDATEFVTSMTDALRLQSAACAQAGSPMYTRLFGELAADYESAGIARVILGTSHPRPIHDAIPLRLAAAVHALVLDGLDHPVSGHYPSVGGSPGPTLLEDFVDACLSHRGSVQRAVRRQVQTNEVGRSIVHLSLRNWLPALGVTTFDHLEVGASAGLTMNFDRYAADTGHGVMGDPSAAIVFGPEWFARPPRVHDSPPVVRQRLGCDTSPLDVSRPVDATRLLSFVWPDQEQRFAATRTAIDIALQYPQRIDEESADVWLGARLPERRDVPVLVFHSIVWQYLGREVQRRMVSILGREGKGRTQDNPLVWARMEPAGSHADVRATVWAGGEPRERVLATVGYHGRGLAWNTADQD